MPVSIRLVPALTLEQRPAPRSRHTGHPLAWPSVTPSPAPCSVEAMAEPHVSPTWQPPSQDEQSADTLDAAERNDLPASAFAFPAERKEPLISASHVRSALSRFDQVQDVTDAERAVAFENIRRAAAHYDVDMTETSWHDLMH
jgi:hypothetical protein